MSPLTTFLSKLIGLVATLVALALAAHGPATVQTVTTLVHTPPLLLILGIVFLTAGLAIVLSHNVWSGGILPVLITLIGWFTMIRGLILLFLPPEAMVALFEAIHFEQFFYSYVVLTLILGAYLTYAGFRASSRWRVKTLQT